MIALLLKAGCYVGDAEAGAETPSQSSIVADFYRVARRDLTEEGIGSSTRRYVDDLPRASRVMIARAAAHDPDARFALFGISLLGRLGEEDDMIVAVADLVTQGRDREVAALYWQWLHEDPPVAHRNSLKVSWYLVGRFDSLPEAELRRTMAFVCTYGLPKALPESRCSKESIRDQLPKHEEPTR